MSKQYCYMKDLEQYVREQIKRGVRDFDIKLLDYEATIKFKVSTQDVIAKGLIYA